MSLPLHGSSRCLRKAAGGEIRPIHTGLEPIPGGVGVVTVCSDSALLEVSSAGVSSGALPGMAQGIAVVVFVPQRVAWPLQQCPFESCAGACSHQLPMATKGLDEGSNVMERCSE